MSNSIFNDLGLTPTKEEINSVTVGGYLDENDSTLAGMTRASWLLVITSNLLVAGFGSGDDDWTSKSIRAIMAKLDEPNTQTQIKRMYSPDSNGYNAMQLFAFYTVQFNLTTFGDVFQATVNNGFVASQNVYSPNKSNVSIFHTLLYGDKNTEVESIIDHFPHRDRTDISGISQATEGFMILRNSRFARLDNKKFGQVEPSTLHMLNKVSKKNGRVCATYIDMFGDGISKLDMNQNLNLDDIVKYITTCGNSEIEELFLNPILKDLFICIFSEEISSYGDDYINAVRVSTGLPTLEQLADGVNEFDVYKSKDYFPPRNESFFNKEVFDGYRLRFPQLAIAPGFSYYCSKFSERVNVEVLKVLARATTANAMALKSDTMSGATPLAFLGRILTIENNSWKSAELTHLYKSMLGTLSATNAEELYKLAMDSTRASEMMVSNYYGGVSNVLRTLCVWYIEDRDDAKLLELSREVFPDFISINAILKWGDEYGIIPKKKEN